MFGFIERWAEDTVAVENTPTIRNLVVCTLCSCYPWPVLGLPPTWYKSDAYRARAVLDPMTTGPSANDARGRLAAIELESVAGNVTPWIPD